MKTIRNTTRSLIGTFLSLLPAIGMMNSGNAQTARIVFGAPVAGATKHSLTYNQMFSMNPDGSGVAQLTSAAANGMFLWAGTQYAPGSGQSWDWMGLGTHPCCSGTGELMFGIWTFDNNWQWAHSGVTPQLNTWQHVAGTWGPGGLRICVNGLLMGANAYAGGAPSGTLYNVIGSSSWANSGIDGLIDEVSIYSRALSASELATIFLAGSGGKCKAPIIVGQTLTGGNLVFSFATLSGQSYTIESTDELAPAHWTAFTNLTGNGSLMQVTAHASAAARRYFRVSQSSVR